MLPTAALRALVSGGHFREALTLYRSAEERCDDADAEARLLAATAAARLGELDVGVSLATAAHQESLRVADTTARTRAANLLGGLALEQGRLAAAETHFDEALRLAQAGQDDLLTAKVTNNLASVVHLRGRADLALALYQRALLYYLRDNDHTGAAQTYHNLGLLHCRSGALGEAQVATTRALRHAEQSGDRGLLAQVLAGRVEAWLELGDCVSAQRNLPRARSVAIEAGDPLCLVDVERLGARIRLRLGEPALAYEAALRAYASAGLLGSAVLEAECAAVCALALRALERQTEANGFHELVTRQLERIGAREPLERLSHEWSSG